MYAYCVNTYFIAFGGNRVGGGGGGGRFQGHHYIDNFGE